MHHQILVNNINIIVPYQQQQQQQQQQVFKQKGHENTENRQLRGTILIFHQILTTNIARQIYKSVKRIEILILALTLDRPLPSFLDDQRYVIHIQ